MPNLLHLRQYRALLLSRFLLHSSLRELIVFFSCVCLRTQNWVDVFMPAFLAPIVPLGVSVGTDATSWHAALVASSLSNPQLSTLASFLNVPAANAVAAVAGLSGLPISPLTPAVR